MYSRSMKDAMVQDLVVLTADGRQRPAHSSFPLFESLSMLWTRHGTFDFRQAARDTRELWKQRHGSGILSAA